MEETLNLPPQSSFAPSTPKKSSDAKDANPWQASWGDLFSSEESDTEFDTDSSPSSNSTAASGMASQSIQPAVASDASSTAQADPASVTGQGMHLQINPFQLCCLMPAAFVHFSTCCCTVLAITC